MSVSALGQSYVVTFQDLAEFSYSGSLDLVDQRALDRSCTQATLDHLYLDQLLPRILAHEGNFVLHGGSVEHGSQAIAILAPTGHGKSTLSASLQSRGHTLLGDDAMIVGLDEEAPTIRAVYPSLRLLPDSVAHIFGDAAETRAMAHYSEKRHVTVPGSDATVPLAMLLFLAPPEPEISLRPMSVAQSCMALIANSFALDPTDRDWAAGNMRRASALAARVPAFSLAYPRDYDRLSEVHDAILAKLSDITQPG